MLPKNNVVWKVFVVLCCLSAVSSSEKRLAAHLTQKYQDIGKGDRPLNNTAGAIKVNISLGIIELQEFDIPNQQLVLVGWTALEWRDEFLVWNPEEYDGVEESSINPDAIWLPDVILANAISKPEEIHGARAHVTSAGHVTWVTTHRYRFFCRIPTEDMESESFPCSMKFASWSMGEQLFDLRNKKDRFDTNFFVTHRDWEFYRNRAKTSKSELPWGNSRLTNEVVYDFVLKRREPLIKEEDLDSSGVVLSSSFVLTLLSVALMRVL